jgi:hypothetical protein
LLPGGLTPCLYEQVVRLGAWIPSFEQAAKLIESFTDGSVVSEATLRRDTEKAGAAYEEIQEQEVARLEQELPPAVAGPAKLVLSADGAMVPLVGGKWEEVKTAVIGEPEPGLGKKAESVVHLRNLSYFSRLTDSNTFQRLALVETHRRGLETAGQVSAPADGSEWIQTFVDFHRPDAMRILDFPHAGEHINAIGQIVLGEGSPAAQAWLETQLHDLKHTGPTSLLAEIGDMAQERPDEKDLQAHVAYLKKREPHMQYPKFHAEGWPIGSGATESANKLVVEARLKGSGMHWARPHVNPMLALRNIVCSDRWNEAWPQIEQALRLQEKQHRAERRQKRRAKCTMKPTPLPTETMPSPPIPPKTVSPPTIPDKSTLPVAAPTLPKPAVPRRPAADHIWRRSPIGKARYWR